MTQIRYKKFDSEIKAHEGSDPDDKGIISGYASTFGNTDRDGDVFESGAFSKSIHDLRQKGLSIPMLASHDHGEIIGGFHPNDVMEDAKGLRVTGKIDLNTQKGAEFFSLAKNGFLTAFSIGFSIPTPEDMEMTQNGMKFKQAELFEISMVPVPANPRATINSVKAVGAATNLPLADSGTAWSSPEAITRVRDFTNSKNSPSATYKRAFMFFDEANDDNFTAYKLPFADVIGGKLMAIPRALFAIVAVLNGARGGVDIPAADRKRIEGIINQYFKRMGSDAPFGDSSGKSLQTELLLCLLKLKRLNYERQ